MLSASTLNIEVTGIMGAGYLPSFLSELCKQLRSNYFRLYPDGRRTRLVAMYHVDNTAVRKWNPYARRRINALIKGRPTSGMADLDTILDAVKISDELFFEAIEDWKEPVDLAFRRGGLLHLYKRVANDPRWRHAIYDTASPPKLQVFLKAERDVIAHSFAHDSDLQHALKREPSAYNASPEEAYDEQEEWFSAVEKLPGLISFTRLVSDKRKFAAELIENLRNPLNVFECNLAEGSLQGARSIAVHPLRQPQIFICYAKEDSAAAMQVFMTLEDFGFSPWLDKEKLLPGQNWDREIKSAIRRSDFFVVLLSTNSVSKRGYVQKELKMALEYLAEFPEGDIFLLPVKLDDCIVPDQFNSYHWIQLNGQGALQKLKEAILMQTASRQARLRKK